MTCNVFSAGDVKPYSINQAPDCTFLLVVHGRIQGRRFEYTDRWTCAGISWAGFFSPPSKLLLRLRGSARDPHLTHGSWAHPRPRPKQHHDLFSRFCVADGRGSQTTDHVTPSVAKAIPS